MAWPSSLDSIVAVATGQPISEVIENEQSAAINAIEQTLGLNPQGSSTTVASALAAFALTQIVPTGAILQYGSTVLPTGYLACDGTQKSTSTYSALFAVLGYAFGSGSGTFGLPNLPGRAVMGASSTHAYASLGGAETEILQIIELPSHSHPLNQTGYLLPVPPLTGPDGFKNTGNILNTQTITNPTTTDATPAANPHNNLQPFTVVNFIIKT